MVSTFMSELERSTLDRNKEDEWHWKANETQTYMVKSTYNILKHTNGGEKGLLYDLFWKVKPYQEPLHMATRDNLYIRGWLWIVEHVSCAKIARELPHTSFSLVEVSSLWKMCDL